MARLPDQIGKYKVVERIGKGGMGMVYKAEHPTLERYVILKKLNISGEPVMRERFRREAEIMIDFRTDYVVDVYDHFRHGSSDYIVLEYIDGLALNEILSQERYLRSDLALLILRDCFRGLDYVHGKGVVHRDVKPGNVIIGRDGSVKLLDFGIASRVATAGDELTREGMTLGTVAYIAPEQIEHSRDVDRRADIYSCGAMLYEMVTGRKAFAGGFTPETVNRIQRGKFRRPRRVNPRVSPLASRIAMRCMQRKPRRRFQESSEPLRMLDNYFARRGEDDLRHELATLAGGGEQGEGAVRRRRRHWTRWPRIAAGAVLLLVAGGIAGWATGTIQRLVLNDTHALARIEIRLRKTDQLVEEHAIRAAVARLEEGRLVDVPLPLPLLRPEASLETPDYLVLRSRLLTVPAGRYRTTFRVENTVTRGWTSLSPVGSSHDVRLLSVQWDPQTPSEVELELDVYDDVTGAAVAEPTVETRIDDEWVVVEREAGGWVRAYRTAGPAGEGRFGVLTFRRAADLPARTVSFAPGETIRVRVSHPDYLTTDAELETGPHTDVARFRLGLVPQREVREMEESR